MLFGSILILIVFYYGANALALVSFIALLFGIPIAMLIKAGYAVPVFSLAVELFGRKSENVPGEGTFMFFVGALIASLFAIFTRNYEIAYLALLPTTFGDGFATIIGTYFGRHKIVGKKSLEGSLAFFIGSALTLYLFIGSLHVSFIVAFLAMLVELMPIDDNLAVPVFSSAILYITKFFNFF